MSKEHINLPKTVFSMKANLPNKEPNLIKYWDKIKLYESLRESTKGKERDVEVPLGASGGRRVVRASETTE